VVDRREALDKANHDLPERWEWEWFTDVMDVDGGTQPPASEFVDGPRPGYVRLVQIRDFESDSHVTYIPDSSKWRKCRTSDVLIARYGASLGRICTGLAGAYNVALAKVVPTDRIHLPFAYHLLRSDYFQGPLLASGGRSAQAGFNKDGLSVIPLPIPPLPEQRAIAHVLGTLDDKIELSRRMNETLEAMVRALFKSWFVDFDPVRAKAEGRDPGLPQPLADLFPDSFEDSELGEIPRGWRAGCVDDEFDLVMGQSPPGDTYNEEGNGLPFYQGRTDFGFRFPTRRVYCAAPTRLAKRGDTLISVRAPVGDINMAAEDCAIGRGVAAARHKTGSRSYSYQFMRSQAEVFDRFEAEGTVFGSIGKKDFHAISCVVPPRGLVVEFERRLAAVDGCIEAAEHETRTLAALRDALLPKLVSGELRLKDAARFIEREAS
jgi:type I restriction enzyme S subunit